jgi:hypothetical protein
MKTPLALAMATMLIAAPASQAAVVLSDYQLIEPGRWVVDFTVINDGTPALISNFTIDLPDFTDLVLLDSPATWDTLLVQPDPSIPDDGFLDSFAIDPADALTLGESIDGFRVQFDFAGGVPPALPFVISDSSFTPLFSGTTRVSAVPEPTSALLAALGLCGVGLGAARRSRGDSTLTRS